MELSITDSAKSAGVTSALLLFIENIEVRKSTPDFIEICENQSFKYMLVIENYSSVGDEEHLEEFERELYEYSLTY